MLFYSCGEEKPKHQVAVQTDSETQGMIEELAALKSQGNILEMWHQNEARAKHYEQLSKQSQDPAQKFSYIFKAAVEWLNAGEYNKSIKLFESVIKQHESGQFNLNDKSLKQFYELLAVAYLRKGEIENCVHHHNQNSCILPLDVSATHKLRKGSEKALEIYELLLQKYPGDAQNIWLYNLAHMTLGQHPQKVNPRFLINEDIFDSEVTMTKFEDVAMQSKVAVNDISGSCIVDDFNNDGYLDIVASSYGLTDQLHYFENRGNGEFVDRTDDANLTGIVSGLNMVQADYNNDGFLDFLILRGAWLGNAGQHPNSLIRNNGDGSFSDVTRSSGLYSLHPTQTAAWGDFNNDGHLDLFIGNESSNSATHKSELFVNNGDGSFTESSSAFGLNVDFFVKGCVWGDIDNDGDLDLYVSNLLGNNLMFENMGAKSSFQFRDISSSSGTQSPMFSFPCWFWDVNNDGLLDLYVNSFDIRDFTTASAKVAADYLDKEVPTTYSSLYINKGQNRFEEVTEEYGLKTVLYTMGCNFADIDNDGFVDFYAATGTPDFRAVFPNRMFKNSQGAEFLDVTTATGTGHIQKGHGVGFGDIDNDGDQDMYVVLGGSYTGDNFMNALFKNPLDNEASWIVLDLEGEESNKSAIGARIRVVVLDANGTSREIYRIVNSGASFGCNSLRQEIGLGNIQSIEGVYIRWPGQTEEVAINNCSPNTFHSIKQGDAAASVITVEAFEL